MNKERQQEAKDLGPAFEKLVNDWGDKANTQDKCGSMKQNMIKGHALRFLPARKFFDSLNGTGNKLDGRNHSAR